jgi:Coenzyme PQQ synthesis protein D (PqqD)
MPDELLVYDQDREKGHCLNAVSALVWRRCDGSNSLEDLARIVSQELGVPEPEAVVGLALEQLGRRHLLVEAPHPLTPDARVSRREALKKLGFAAALLPLIMTVATKTSAQFGSGGGGGGGSSNSTPAVTVQPTVNVNVAVGTGGHSTPPPPPCRTRGQSCVAASSGQQGTCCAGLSCTGVSQNAGVCG